MRNVVLRRAAFLAALLLVELLAVTNWLDGADLAGRSGWPGQLGHGGTWVLRFLVGFSAAFAAFAGVQGTWKNAQSKAGESCWTWLAAHFVIGAAFLAASAALYGNWPGVTQPNALVAAWLLLGLLAVLAACLGVFPARFWASLFHVPPSAWITASLVSALGVAVVVWSQSLWQSTARLTFGMVQILLRPIIPALTVDVSRLRIKGNHFGVIISQECSGLEGVGLMLIFSSAWLWLYRRDFRFPRSFLLVPAGILTLFVLNSVRIATLLLLGDAGAERIAAGGFHSQAGWIAFNGVALGMTLIAPRIRWFSLHPATKREEVHHENPTAAYLIPFLAILAAGMLARAASADFEWLYGLRFLAAAGTLWMFRAQLRSLDWRCGWLGAATGVGVFALWLAFDRWQGTPALAMPRPLAEASGPLQVVWIAFRAIAATTTVPIAEELAFRGFLIRRFVSADFESVPLRSAPWPALLASSVAFGLLHGDRWIAGVLAGLAFAWVARTTNRIGDAVVAHALTNGLLATWVLCLNQWQYW
jgi:exosortase E/protease (VPEID-CTERM system)